MSDIAANETTAVERQLTEVKATVKLVEDTEKEVPKVRRYTRWAMYYFYFTLFISVGILIFSTGIMDMGVDIMNGGTGRTICSFFGLALLVLAPLPYLFKMENAMVKTKDGKSHYNPNWKHPLLSMFLSTLAYVMFILSIAVF